MTFSRNVRAVNIDRRAVTAPRTIAKTSASIADELKGHDIVVLDVRKLCDITDYLVICTGDNRRQLRAMKVRLSEGIKKLGVKLLHAEGEGESSWILLDFGDVVVHLFDAEAREFYDLELLWGDAPKVAWQRSRPSPPRTLRAQRR